MYYLKISDKEGEENALIYYCRNCGNEDKTIIADNVCVSETQLRRSEQKFTFMVNEYTKYDPTLPRINMIKCPNQECSSNTAAGGAGKVTIKKKTPAEKEDIQKKLAMMDAAAAAAAASAVEPASQAQEPEQAQIAVDVNQREVIYILYDDINMKNIYLCEQSENIWKTDNRI